ncbi:MAG TPA: transglycosylase SLT domain-containing protein [Geobacteraceae bacterium]|nr:transglycosylase SLT domain-containing protein [Geobacteraceae bacterium]
MMSRFTVLFLSMLFLSVPASALNTRHLPDDSLIAAAVKVRNKDYRGAMEAARNAPEGGMKDFLLGMSSARLEEWETSADYLGKSVAGFPLLADYALYNRALALYRLARYSESLAALEGLVREYPESPLIRSADRLLADILFDSGSFRDAGAAYQRFIEKYASGSDALTALYRIALCRERTGDTAGAAATLRSIPLNYPASPMAEIVEEDLQRLKTKGAIVPPYSAEELLRRATVLSDLGKYRKAMDALDSIPLESQTDEFICRLMMKSGQGRFKARYYREAEKTFSGLLARKPRKEIVDEARFWIAKSLDKNGKEDEAFATYVKLAESSPNSTLADDALLAAAFIRKFQNNASGELTVLKRLTNGYPRSNLLGTAFWEIAWQSYLAGDLKSAADYFKKLLDSDRMRDRNLYWYGRTLAAAGNERGAGNAFARLLAEYPFGYYALAYKKGAKFKEAETGFLSAELCDILPEPVGFERAKALIALGLYEEAGRELSFARKKLAVSPGLIQGIARLYLEMGDYHGAFSIVDRERLRSPDKSSLAEWGICYPRAFRELVTDNAEKSGIPDCLIYSIMRAESNFFPSALSPAGAVGLMQIMPATAAAIANGNSEKSGSDRLTRPELNIRFGVKHLKDLLALYKGDPVLAVAAYNAGAGNVNRWLRMSGKVPTDVFIENIPFPETREYVKKVLAGSEIYRRIYRLRSSPELSGTTTLPPDMEVPPIQPPSSRKGESRYPAQRHQGRARPVQSRQFPHSLVFPC